MGRIRSTRLSVTTSRYHSRTMDQPPVRLAALPRTSHRAPPPRTGALRYLASSHPRPNRRTTCEGYHRSVGYLEPAWRGQDHRQDVEPDTGATSSSGPIVAEGGRTYAPRPWRIAPTRPPEAGVAARRCRSAAGPAWLVKAPLAGSDGRTNPLRHRRLFTDSPSRSATSSAPPGRGTYCVFGARAEPWRSDNSEHEMCRLRCHHGHVEVCTRAQVTAVPLRD